MKSHPLLLKIVMFIKKNEFTEVAQTNSIMVFHLCRGRYHLHQELCGVTSRTFIMETPVLDRWSSAECCKDPVHVF